jgi:hypothetical protein
VANVLQLIHLHFNILYEFGHIDGILAGLIQEELEIERLIVIVAICIGVIDGIVIIITILCDFYHGLILFHHLITLLYEKVFELLVLLD